MNRSHNTHSSIQSSGERGQARLKLLITLIIIAVVAYSIYQYAPVAYHAFLLKDFMQDRVNYAVDTGKPSEWVEQQLRASAQEYDLPQNALVNAQLRDGRMEAHVKFTRPIQLPGYVYQYNFDQTVKSASFLTVK